MIRLYHRVRTGIHSRHQETLIRFDWYRRWHAHPHVELFHRLTLWAWIVGILAVFIFYSTAEARVNRITLDLGIKAPAVEIGRSVRNKPIYGYYFGQGATIFVIGAIHGNEQSSAYLSRDLANFLADHPEEIPQGRKVIVVPIANPDGFLRGLRSNVRNVDLNRNFATSDWRKYSQATGGKRVFAGKAPFSEREATVLKKLLESEDIYSVIALHARGNLVNPEYSVPSKELARRYSNTTGYRYEENWGSYLTTGTLTLWVVEKFNAPAITVELATYHDAEWERNRQALLEAIKQ